MYAAVTWRAITPIMAVIRAVTKGDTSVVHRGETVEMMTQAGGEGA
jgi:hypothetical protein